MNLPLPSASSWSAPSQQAFGQPAPRRNWARRLINVAVAIVVIAVAGATFVFSYSGVHAVALLGGVSVQLARYYPGVFDALLVIACVAAVVLRDGRWWARLWAWLVAVVVLAAIGWVDVIHAMNYGLEHRATEGAVAAAPVVAVLLAFSLLLTMLRQSRPLPVGPGGPRGQRGRFDPQDGPATETMPTILMPAVSGPTVPSTAISAGPGAGGPYPGGPYPAGPYPAGPYPAAQPWDLPTSIRNEPIHYAPVQDEPVQDESAQDESAQGQIEPDAATETDAVAEADEPGEPDQPATPAAFAETDSPSDRTRPIRYAGKSARDKPASDYWDGQDDPELAGQVYPAREVDHDLGGFDDPDKSAGSPAQQATGSAGADADGSPFVMIPRLNRARVTPTPPRDDED